MSNAKQLDRPEQSAEETAAHQIAQALREGRPEDVTRLTGRPSTVRAPVAHGDGRGRTMGFPTANMHLTQGDELAFGIYAVRVRIEGDAVWRDGVANYGIRPMYRTADPLMEVHLLDFDGDLYDKLLSVRLIAWLRPEAVFSGQGALIAQIAADVDRARRVLGGHITERHFAGPASINSANL